MDQRIRCPNPACPEPYDVQKVSEIIRAGTTSTSSTSTSTAHPWPTYEPTKVTTSSSSTGATQLAKDLERQRPRAPEKRNVYHLIPPPASSTGEKIGCTAGLGFAGFCVGIVIAAIFIEQLPHSSTLRLFFALALTAVGIGIGIYIGIKLYGESASDREWRRKRFQEYAAADRGADEELKVDTARYRAAADLYSDAYYSPRCGSVFIPGKSQFAPVTQMSTILYPSAR